MNYKLSALVISFAVFVVSVAAATDGRAGVLVNWILGEYNAVPEEEGMPRFQLFRYQILPTTRDLQGALFDPDIKTIDQLLARKNGLFAQELTSIKKFRHRWIKTDLSHSFVYGKGPIYLLRLGVSRQVTLKTIDFKYQRLTNWPWTHVVIDNDEDAQKVAIQVYPEAFEDTATVAKILESNLNGRLKQYQLQVHFKPIFEVHRFWSLVKEHKDKIKGVKFHLITPNLSAIAKDITGDLKNLFKATNSQESDLNLQSAPGSTLVLSSEDKNTKALAKYCAAGGGSISLTLKGYKKTVSTNQTITEIEIPDFNLEGVPTEAALDFAKSLLMLDK